MKFAKQGFVFLATLSIFGASAALAGYTLGQPVPGGGQANVSTNPLSCTESISWTATDAPVYNGYTVLSGVPPMTVPQLASSQFQTGYPQLLQSSIIDRYTFTPAVPPGTAMSVMFTFIAIGGNNTITSNFTTK